MKPFINISISEEGEHWDKEVRLFGILIYHRHDYTNAPTSRPTGFTIYPAEPVSVESEEFFPDEEFKRK